MDSRVAQLAEQVTVNHRAVGSSPTSGAIKENPETESGFFVLHKLTNENKATFPQQNSSSDPRWQDSGHSSRYAATSFHRHLGCSGGRPRFRALVEPEAAKLVPGVPARAARRYYGWRSRDSRPRGTHEKRALERRCQPRLFGEIPHARVDQIRPRSRTREVQSHDYRIGAVLVEETIMTILTTFTWKRHNYLSIFQSESSLKCWSCFSPHTTQ